MKQGIKSKIPVLAVLSVVCFFFAFFLHVPVFAQADQPLIYDANGSSITLSASDVFGVEDDGEFEYSGFDSLAFDTAENLATYTGNFGTGYVSYWTQNAFSAVTLNFASVLASEYDTVEINYLGANYDGASCDLYIYVFSCLTENYVAENAVYSCVIQESSIREISIKISSELLADENGEISSFTIARAYENKNETVAGNGFIDYISFYNNVPVQDNAIYTQLYVEEMHEYSGGVYAWSNGIDYFTITDTLNGFVYDEGANVSEIVGLSSDKLQLFFKGKQGEDLCAELNYYGLYLTLSDEHRGFGDSTGWEEIKDVSQICNYVTINGIKLSDITHGFKVNAAGPRSLLFLFDYGIFDVVAGDSLVLEIPKGTKASKNYQGEGFEFIAKTVCTLDKSTLQWTVDTDPVDWGVPELGEKELSDCSHAGITVYTGEAYEEKANYDFSSCAEGSVIDKNGRNWHTNSQTELLAGTGYVSTAPKGDGSNDMISGTFYKMSWGQFLDYPSIIVEFPYQTAEYEKSDYLVLKIYVSSKITAQAIWFTNIDTAHIDNGEKVDLPERDVWTEVKVKASKFLNADGTGINPIGITFYYGTGVVSKYENNEVYFDSFFFRSVVRNVKENYTVNDISEIVPITKTGYTFVGEWEAGELNADNYSEYESSNANVAFCRMDCNANAIKMKVKVYYEDKYNFYFTMNAPELRYDKGGVNFWFADTGITIGGRGNKALEIPWEDLPSDLRVSSGVQFVLELGAIPYMVDGVRSGYYAYIKIDGVDVLDAATIAYKEKAYIDEGDMGGMNGFGNYFGLYLHDSTDDVSVTVYPETMTDECPLIVSLKTRNNAKRFEKGDMAKLLTEVSMKIFGGKQSKIIVVEDSGAYLQGRDTIVADRNGKFKATITYECCFGSFQSNLYEVSIGTGVPDYVWVIVGVASGVVLGGAVAITIILLKKKKTK